MKKWSFAVCALLALVCGGCVFAERPQKEVTLYDLAVPETAVKGPLVRHVFNNSPTRLKMLYREQNGRIRETADVCWVQSPEVMLKRYLASAIQPDPARTAELTILRFELDETRSRAVIAAELATLSCEGPGTKVLKYIEVESPLSGSDGAAASAAMSGCAGKLVKILQSIK